MKKLLFAISCVVSLACSGEAAVVGWGAATDNGFSLPDGNPLPVGNEIRLGHFSIPDAQIQQLYFEGNLQQLDSFFTQIGTALMGEGPIVGTLPESQRHGHFEKSTNADTDAAGVSAKQIYLWAFATGDSSAVAAAFTNVTASGVFYLANSASWLFPSNDSIPNRTDIDISDLTSGHLGSSLVDNARIVLGTFPNGVSATGSTAPNFGLIAIPEPASTGLFTMGLVGLLMRRRRDARS